MDAGRHNGAGAGQKRVLIVDRHADSAETLAGLLRELGHEVLVARGPGEGLEQFRAAPPHVVLLDLGVAADGGHELAREMRHMRGATVMLCAISGDGRPRKVSQLERAAFDYHLIKPLDLATLKAIVR